MSDIIDAVKRQLEKTAPKAPEKPDSDSGADMERVAGEMIDALQRGDKKRLARILRAMKEI